MKFLIHWLSIPPIERRTGNETANLAEAGLRYSYVHYIYVYADTMRDIHNSQPSTAHLALEAPATGWNENWLYEWLGETGITS